MKMPKLAIVLIALTLFTSAQAQASFTFKEKKKEPSEPKTETKLSKDKGAVLTQIGDGDPKQRVSLGKDVSLAQAMELITPKKWGVRVEEGIKDRLTWKSSSKETWIETLKRVGKQEGLRFVVNWETQEIAAGKGKAKALAEKTKGTKRDSERETKAPETKTPEKDERAKNVADDKQKHAEKSADDKGRQKDTRPETEPKDKRAKKEKDSRDESRDIVVMKDSAKKILKFKEIPKMYPQELREGRLKEEVSEWAEEWGYKTVMEGIEEINSLTLSKPLNLQGEKFLEDLDIIARDLNSGSSFKFSFNVYKANNVLEVVVTKK